ncbi:hypothetical protein [Chitinilyticum piscinae]|uniref:Uncharacterized protein n=1 Tax=Chitinilyticum piscinae TaxID=2866724 RepID=A0A8J7FIL0_9NEIS|nr:hypothetical protein [Chitinilyticum piscinae]MBE9609970.1 hypothetical protein [Chitinilyticum piscinae]
MTESVEFALYVGAKLLAYAAWAGLGLRLLRGRATLSGALGFGLLRLALGVVFGVTIFVVYHPQAGRDLLLDYVLIYVPVRWLEWSLLALLMVPQRPGWLLPRDGRQIAWRLGGIVLSFAVDMLLYPGSSASRFCVGRCLC